MADIVSDLNYISALANDSIPYQRDVKEIANRAILEIESLRRSLGIFADDLEPIGAVSRSPHWPAVRAAKLKQQPTCEATGSTDDLEVHHIIPFHEDPALELSEANLIVLNRPAHFIVGHLCSWRSWNPNIRKDAANLLKKIQARP